MRKQMLVVAVLVLGFLATPFAQAPNALNAAAQLLGAAGVKSLLITGSGTQFSVGQNYSPAEPWPAVAVKTYTALIDFDKSAMRVDMVRQMGAVMPRGGGAPFTGEQRQIQVVGGDFAWNVPPAAPGGQAAPAAPAPGAQLERMLTLWSITPQGFVKAALANNATLKKSGSGTEASFMVGGYKMTGVINAQNQVERVQTWIDQPIVGDMLVDTTFSGYKEIGGLRFPSHIVQKQDGLPSLDLTISSVTPNSAADIQVPDNVRNFRPAPVVVNAQQLADGVFYLTGGTHHSLAVAMKDHIVLVDTPNDETRALAVIAKAKEVIPGKPIRYIVTSHHHWDHLGGIRTAMDEGATIVTHQSNKAFLERVAKTVHTINPDHFSKSKKPVKIQAVGSKGVLTDGVRTIELHLLTNYEHTGDMLVVYLPKEKILAEPDAFTAPPTPDTPLVVTAVPYAVSLYDNIQRLKLDVQTIAPFHGNRTTTVAELAKAAGKAAGN